MEEMIAQNEGRNNVSECNNGSHWLPHQRDSRGEIGMTARWRGWRKQEIKMWEANVNNSIDKFGCKG